jgi:MFS family permease
MTAGARRPLGALLLGQGVSALGSQMTFLALPWFVLATTGSATKMGLVLAAEILPIAVLGIPSGTVVTRLGVRRTMMLGDAGRAPLIAAIPLLHRLGWLSFPLLLALVALLGVFIAPYFSSQRLILPELLGDDETAVGKANAILEGVQRLAGLLGPAVAGVLIATIGAPKRSVRRRRDVRVLSFFGPLVNAPLIAVVTTGTPEHLRAKVTTAVITTAMLAGPIGFVVAGQLLGAFGPHTVFLLVAAGQLAATLPFLAVAFRAPAAPSEPEPA